MSRSHDPHDALAPPAHARFEILPFGDLEKQAAQIPASLAITVTCSPKHGPERSIRVAARMRELGHIATVHIAARTVRDQAHLDQLLQASARAGVEHWFVIGGDGRHPVGKFASAVELLPLVAAHPLRPATLGIAGYPEGHPLIDAPTLARALAAKSELADYVVTQLCFDPDVVRAWVIALREHAVALPVWLGMPGQVSAAQLLEVSMRIGVGPSLRFVRKQHNPRNLFGLFGGLHSARTRRLHRALSALAADRELGVAGLHCFTFNQLAATWSWQRASIDAPDRPTCSHPQRARAGISRGA